MHFLSFHPKVYFLSQKVFAISFNFAPPTFSHLSHLSLFLPSCFFSAFILLFFPLLIFSFSHFPVIYPCLTYFYCYLFYLSIYVLIQFPPFVSPFLLIYLIFLFLYTLYFYLFHFTEAYFHFFLILFSPYPPLHSFLCSSLLITFFFYFFFVLSPLPLIFLPPQTPTFSFSSFLFLLSPFFHFSCSPLFIFLLLCHPLSSFNALFFFVHLTPPLFSSSFSSPIHTLSFFPPPLLLCRPFLPYSRCAFIDMIMVSGLQVLIRSTV